MATVTKEIEDLKNRTLHLERILILGDGDRLPLAEVVRNLTNTVNDYITQKQMKELPISTCPIAPCGLFPVVPFPPLQFLLLFASE